MVLSERSSGGENTVKCPMLTMYATTFKKAEEYEDRECLQKGCAWWEDDLSMCAVKEMALEVRYTQQRLADLVERMPKGGS